MSSLDEIDFFLYGFKSLKQKYGLIIYPREKNLKALFDLELTAIKREEVIDSLVVTDYYKGPKPNGMLKGHEYWEFGKCVYAKDIYIKLSLGLEDGAVFCLSFHQAERPIRYPFKV